ncbi:MAG TPA: hypothetical protein PLV92_26805 [Pirellulaceae bacterium]|nr:hypothetical protein [Pirellulaceae bacterium]
MEEIERVTLPQATEALQRAQQRRDALGALHLDRQLTNVNARLATAQSEVVRLETEAATLERRTAELRVREGELNNRRSTLRDSQRTHEQLETRFTLQQDETSAAVSQRITALQQLEEDVRALRTRLEPSQAPTGNVRWWSFLTRGGRS